MFRCHKWWQQTIGATVLGPYFPLRKSQGTTCPSWKTSHFGGRPEQTEGVGILSESYAHAKKKDQENAFIFSHKYWQTQRKALLVSTFLDSFSIESFRFQSRHSVFPDEMAKCPKELIIETTEECLGASQSMSWSFSSEDNSSSCSPDKYSEYGYSAPSSYCFLFKRKGRGSNKYIYQNQSLEIQSTQRRKKKSLLVSPTNLEISGLALASP